MAPFPATFSTERLRLRRLVENDVNEVFSYASDPQVAHFMTFPCAKSPDDVRPFLKSIQPMMDEGNEFTWGIEVAGTTGVVGSVSFRRSAHGLEFGWILRRDVWGNGYMVEAGRALIDWAFTAEGAQRVWATCDVENDKSARVMEKLGMEEEGVLRRWSLHPNLSEVPRDCRVFSILSS